MVLLPHGPEPCASANSATSANHCPVSFSTQPVNNGYYSGTVFFCQSPFLFFSDFLIFLMPHAFSIKHSRYGSSCTPAYRPCAPDSRRTQRCPGKNCSQHNSQQKICKCCCHKGFHHRSPSQNSIQHQFNGNYKIERR